MPNLAESLDDERLTWKPEGCSTSIGFHLWHLGRESDYLKAAILYYTPQFVPEFGDGQEVWQKEKLAQRWEFHEGTHETVGTGLSDAVAAALPIPKKEELLGCLRSSCEAIECFSELHDAKYPNFDNLVEDLRKKIKMIRLNLLDFLTHDCRHLGMMEYLKGLQTGFGSATGQRSG